MKLYLETKLERENILMTVISKELLQQLNLFLESVVDISRMRYGKKQTLDTLISEEALLLAKHLRNEKKDWVPRIA